MVRDRALGDPGMTTRAWNFAIRAAARAETEADGKRRAREVWDAMRLETRPSEYTLSELARALCRRRSDVREAMGVMREAVSSGGTMNSFALDALITACARELREERAKGRLKDEKRDAETVEIVMEVWKSGRGYHNEVSLANAMRVFRLCGREDLAMTIFKENEVKTFDARLLKIALQCCAGVEGLASAEKMYREATAIGGDIVAETGHANTLLYAAKDEGDHAFATKFFDDMLGGVEPPPDESSLSLVILACAKAKEPDLAMKYFERGGDAGIKYTDSTIDALLRACSKSGRIIDALSVFMDAIEQGIKVTERTITLLVESYEHVASQPDQLAQALTFADMGAFLNIEPSERMIKALLRLCVAGNDIDRGRLELRKALERGVPMTCTSVTIIAEALVSRGNVEEALDIIRFGRERGIKINPGAFIQTISVIKVRNDGAGALTLYKAARGEFGLSPNERMLEELFDALGRAGMWKDALRVLSDDVLVDDGALKSFSEPAVAHLVRALCEAGEFEQAVAALDMGRLLTGTPNDLASRRLERAKQRAKKALAE